MKYVSNKQDLKTLIKYTTAFFAMFLMIINVSYELWEEWQVPKDRHYYAGIVWACILIILFREKIYVKIETWVTLFIGLALVVAWIKIKGINPDNYGEIYSKILIYKRIIWVLCGVLFVDLFRGKNALKLLKKNCVFVVIFLLIVILCAKYDKENVYPLLFPFSMFIFTDFNEKDKRVFSDLLAASFLLVSFVLLMKSYYLFPDRLEAGRYRGGFISTENFGTFSGAGVICGIYFFIRVRNIKNIKWFYWLIPVSLIALPLYSLLACEHRVSLTGLLGAIIFLLLFIRKKNDTKNVIKRICICLVSGAILVALLPVIGKIANVDREWKYGAYAISHIAALDPDSGRWDGYFGEKNILNAINALSSERLAISAEAIKQITFKGHPFEIREPINSHSPHNYFIQKVIELGLIPGMLYISWIVYCYFLMIINCVKKRRSSELMLLMSSYSIIVLSGTILTLRSILATLLFMFLSFTYFDSFRRDKSLTEIPKGETVEKSC